MGKIWGRRDFLRAAGIVSSAALLEGILPEPVAEAQAGPKRIIFIVNGNGCDLTRWRRSSGGENDFVLGSSLEPFETYRDNLLFLDGIDNEASFRGASPSGHDGVSAFLTGRRLPRGPFKDGLYGWPEVESLETTIAKRIGTETAFDSYYWGTYPAVRDGQNQGPNGMFFHRGQDAPVDAVIDPRRAFDALFEGVSGDMVDPALERRRLERRSILDAVSGDLTRLRPQLPEADRDRMDQHLEGLRQLERRLVAPPASACAPPERPESLDPRNYRNTGLITELQFAMMGHALACDLTRVACFSWSHAPGTGEYLADYGYPGFGQLHTNAHDVSYGADAGEGDPERQNMANLTQWRSRMIVEHLLAPMDPVVRDNTILVWAMDMSEGGLHSNRNVPVTIFQGSDLNEFRTGRYLKWGEFEPLVRPRDSNEYRGGVPMNRVLVSLAQAMGLDDVTSYGDADIGEGRLEELY